MKLNPENGSITLPDGNTIAARVGVVRRQELDACLR